MAAELAHRGGARAARLRGAYRASMAFLDDQLFPHVVAYATHPLVILLTILLLVPLIVFASVTALALILGNYTNVVSAAVSSIVLMQSMQHHQEVKRLHAAHAADMAALHAKLDATLAAVAPPPELPVRPDSAETKPHRTVATVHVNRAKGAP